MEFCLAKLFWFFENHFCISLYFCKSMATSFDYESEVDIIGIEDFVTSLAIQ